MRLNNEKQMVKAHAGSYFIALGTVLLFLGEDGALSIANNYLFYLAGILINLIDVLIKWDYDIKLSPLFLFTSVLIVALDIVHMGFGIYDRGAMVSIVFYLLLVLSVMAADFNYMDAKVISNGVIISAVVFTSLIMFSGRELYPGSKKFTFVQWFGTHEVFDPNFLGALMTLGFCLAVYSVFGPVRHAFAPEFRIIYYISGGITLLGVVLTGSRSAMLSVCIFAMMIFVLMKPGTLKKRLYILATVGLFMLIIMIALGIIPRSLFTRVFSISSYMDDSNRKRIKDWTYGIKLILDRPLFGNGPALTEDLIMYHYSFSGEAHNTFLTAGVMYGIPLLLLVCLHIVRLIKKSLRKRDIIMVALMTAMLFEWNILPCQFTVTCWLTVVICFIMGNTTTRRSSAGRT